MSRARELRITMTDAERRLWSALRGRRLRGFKFRRQHRLGPFIADFVCVEHRLVIEADGGQHAESAVDARRTAWLEARGWRVLRNGPLPLPQAGEGLIRTASVKPLSRLRAQPVRSLCGRPREGSIAERSNGLWEGPTRSVGE